MSVAEMKVKVIEELMKLSEEKLKQVTDFIESINGLPVDQSTYLKHAQDVIKERSIVLEKLAQ